jgi:disulfide oxidoreductase YuzD
MQFNLQIIIYASALICAGCASAPSSNASAIKPTCAQQCKDSYDACIQDCMLRATTTSSLQQSTVDKLNKLDEFLNGVK